MPIRPVEHADLPVLRNIESAAGEAFRAVGMPEIADDELPPLEWYDAYRAAGRAWIYDEVAYLLMDVVDGLSHIEQVSVHPAAAGRGLGRQLIDHLAAQTPGRALTLTTFTDVPWNAPYYRRLGFAVFQTPGPELTQVRRREQEHGLDRWPRICMIRRPTAG